MRFHFFSFFFLAKALCFEYFLDNTSNSSTENGSFEYPFRQLDDALRGYIIFSNGSDSLFEIRILTNTYNYSFNEDLFNVKKTLKISFMNETTKAGIIFSSGSFKIEENGKFIKLKLISCQLINLLKGCLILENVLIYLKNNNWKNESLSFISLKSASLSFIVHLSLFHLLKF